MADADVDMPDAGPSKGGAKVKAAGGDADGKKRFEVKKVKFSRLTFTHVLGSKAVFNQATITR